MHSQKLNPVNQAICLFLVMSAITLSGCGTTKQNPDYLSLAVSEETVSFEKPVAVRVPAHDPTTPEELIRAGLFYKKNGHYEKAADSFRLAANQVDEPTGEFYRSSLAAGAICALLAGDREGFLDDVQRLHSSYSRWVLMEPSRLDDRVELLFQLQNQLTATNLQLQNQLTATNPSIQYQ